MEKIQIPNNLQDFVYDKFKNLPLKSKLIIYAKLMHGNAFKPQNKDFFGLNRRIISKIFRSFVDSIRSK